MATILSVPFTGKLVHLSKGAREGSLASTGLMGEVDQAKREVLSYCNNKGAVHTREYTRCFEQATDMSRQRLTADNNDLFLCELVTTPLRGILSQVNLISAYYPQSWNKQLRNLLVATYGDFSDFLLGFRLKDHTPADLPRPWIKVTEPTPEQTATVAKSLDEMMFSLIRTPFLERLTRENLIFVQEIRRHLKLHFPQNPSLLPSPHPPLSFSPSPPI